MFTLVADLFQRNVKADSLLKARRVMTSDINEWLSLAKSLIDGEKTCYADMVKRQMHSTNPLELSQALSLSLEATKAKGRRENSLVQLKELASKCRAVALSQLSKAEFAECSRDLDSIISAIAELQKWDDFGEFSREGVARFGSDLVNPLNRVAVYRGRFEPRLKAAEAALKSDALEVLKAVADVPAGNKDKAATASPSVARDELIAAPLIPKRMDKDLAEIIARKLDKADPQFNHGDAEAWAKRIREHQSQLTGELWSCSKATVHSTAFWGEVMIASGRGRKSRSVPTVAFSAKAVATVEGEDSVLNELAAREEQPAIDAVMQSGMDEKGKAATVNKIKAGEMTLAQAIELAKQFPIRPKQKKSRLRE